MNTEHLWLLAGESGGILYGMAVIMLLGLTIIVDRVWYMRKVLRSGKQVIAAMAGMEQWQLASVRELAQKHTASPHGALLQSALRHADVGGEKVERMLDEVILLQTPRVDRGLWMLDTIVTLAPLLGLLGTIFGMFNTFHALGQVDEAASQVSGGIAEALLATAVGLCIAIAGLVCFNGLNNGVRHVVHQMETLKSIVVNRLQLPDNGLVDSGLHALPRRAEA